MTGPKVPSPYPLGAYSTRLHIQIYWVKKEVADMDAKKELIDQLKTMAGCCENELKVLLDGYCITREPVRERSNLKKQISALTAKK